MKALIVDDSRAMRVILSGLMRGLGFDVSEARHGREALAHLNANTDTALALVDWNMPEMNGLELVKAVRRDERFGDLRIVMVTTETETSQVVKAIEAGASEYVMKPFTRDIIEDKVRMLGLAPRAERAA